MIDHYLECSKIYDDLLIEEELHARRVATKQPNKNIYKPEALWENISK